MNKIRLFSLIAVTTMAATSIAAHAHGGGGGVSAGLRAGGDFGGRSASHIGAEGLRNSNGPDALDRDKGRARAADRYGMQSGNRHAKTHLHGDRH
ncbi:hypothetical protein [Cupriavidus pinatubonensis]|uniref:Uncharacterized protein n=1 Tax=Cupriavidus pinatubonensis TaxID=248026 RepID=A0ABM8Y454_9BURK|nr:hypothetical protein [Cupriavidus pinatubonensis]CAG9187559.1 hypothetical protein LMG23994_07004 [Cupriavidus pinatubonensis]